MKRIFKWIGRQLVAELRQELATIGANIDAHRVQLDELVAKQEGQRSDLQAVQASQAALREFQAEDAQRAGAQIALLSETLAAIRARIEVALADAGRAREEAKQEAAVRKRDLAGLKDATRNYLDHAARINSQGLSWSKDTAKMIGDLRAEVRLFLQEPTFASTAADGEAGDPQLLRRYVEGSNIREIYPTELFQGLEQESLPIASINERSGHANQVDLMYVAAIAKLRQARSIFEFGTYEGRTTYHLTFASEDAHVTTLDLPPQAQESSDELGRMFRGTDREGRVTQLLIDSDAFDPLPYSGSMDFVFIDADHSYELVKNDTEKALIMLRPGGVIVWHDYAVKSPGVVRYIQEFASSRPVFRLRHTCLIVYVDGVDAVAFEPGQRLPQADGPEVVPLHRASARRARGEG